MVSFLPASTVYQLTGTVISVMSKAVLDGTDILFGMFMFKCVAHFVSAVIRRVSISTLLLGIFSFVYYKNRKYIDVIYMRTKINLNDIVVYS